MPATDCSARNNNSIVIEKLAGALAQGELFCAFGAVTLAAVFAVQSFVGRNVPAATFADPHIHGISLSKSSRNYERFFARVMIIYGGIPLIFTAGCDKMKSGARG